ncbi:MAG TPA: 5'-3' exonuclease [Candidatus Limnocylindria bacterium]|nr:5'-3' exonuclease [Candidatus Limnocylindria bacterium]
MTLLLLDASSLAYRAYHAIPELTAPDGQTKTNAVHGFLNFLARLITDRMPSRLMVALDDDWRPAFRVEVLPTYKTHRLADAADAKDTVEPQIELACEVLASIGLAIASAKGYEAEDAIAAIVARERGTIEIVTGDRDLFALVRDPDVRVLYTLRGVSELAIVDEAYVARTYGIPGDRYADYAILRGDPSDGLPGVRGIGEKSAAELVRRYGSLDGILAATDLSPTMRAKLSASAAYLSAARRVVPPQRDSPVEVADGAIPRRAREPQRLKALADRYAIGGPIDRVLKAIGTLPG